MFKRSCFPVFTAALACWFASAACDLTRLSHADWPIVEYSSVNVGFNPVSYPPLPEGAVLVPEMAVGLGTGTGGWVSGSVGFDTGLGGLDATSELLAHIERARHELDADDFPELTDAEQTVVQAMADVEAYLDRNTPAENFAAWMRYLKLDPLLEAIDDDGSVNQRGRAAVELASRLRGIEAGLELPSIMKLRDAVDQYIAALLYSDPKRGIAMSEKQLDDLVDLLSPEVKDGNEDGNPKKSSRQKNDADSDEKQQPQRKSRPLSELSPEDVAKLELIIGGLSDANQASDLVGKIRGHYSEPNIRGWLDGRIITDALSRPVNNPDDVNECILGTRLIGNAHVNGNVVGQLLPADGHVRVMLRMDGLLSMSARGFRKPVTVDTTGMGNVYAARQLAITERGITLGETIATADLTTQIQRINHPLKIVRRIGMKKAREQQPRAEAISQGKMRAKIYRRFDEQTAAAAAREIPSLDALINPWLRRLDFPSLVRTIGSTTDTIYVRGTLQQISGLAARQSPPPLSMIRSPSGSGVYPGGYFGAVQIHQSVLDNTIVKLLAGETLSPARIESLASGLGLELPKRKSKTRSNDSQASNAETRTRSTDSLELQDAAEQSGEEDGEQEEQDGFEVDLARFRPVFIEADDQSLRVGLRGTRFSQGDREQEITLEVAAVYRPVQGGDGTMWLVRDEEISLSFPGTRRLTIKQTAIKSNMEKSFNELFPRELLHRSFSIPSDAKMPALAGRTLQISAIDFTDGWISIVVR